MLQDPARTATKRADASALFNFERNEVMLLAERSKRILMYDEEKAKVFVNGVLNAVSRDEAVIGSDAEA